MTSVPIGMVHGRFQPFHKEQLQYVLSGLAKCDELVVGITNPDESDYVFAEESDHRHRPEANPFSFYDRQRMVKESLIDVGVDWRRVTVVLFHLFDVSKWSHYLPLPASVVQFVRVFSPWEARKMSLFESYGFRVVEIDRGGVKTITSTEVRRLIRDGGEWRSLVPDATARIIDLFKGQGL
jgi:nicotinamide mononucleotide adenylyltransferase